MSMLQSLKKNKVVKIIIGIYHPAVWFFFLFAILLVVIGESARQISVPIVNLVFIFAIGPVTLIIHETGHLVMGRLVGAIPRRMVLGKGHKLIDFKIGKVKVVINSFLGSGLAYVAYSNLKFIRIRMLGVFAGGILFNLLAAALTILFFGFELGPKSELIFPEMFVFTNLVAVLFTLIPYQSKHLGFSNPSDGLAMLQIPFIKKEDLAELVYSNDLMDMYDLMEEKKYHAAIVLLDNYRAATGKKLISNLNSSVAYLKLGEFDKSAELLEELIPNLNDEHKKFKAHICNALAWTYLITKRLAEADLYSAQCFELNKSIPEFCGTRAAVLIERGELEIGAGLLEESASLTHITSHTLTAAMYLAYVYHVKKNKKKYEDYALFVTRNIERLDLDERTLYDRLCQRMLN